MSTSQTLDPSAVAKVPSQPRAKQRFESILKESEALLLEAGLAGFSIPALAERLGYTRGSVYAYFPTAYAVINELASRYLAELEALYVGRREDLSRLNWRDAVRMVVDEAVNYYNQKPIASLLILGGAATDDGYRAQELTIKRLGDLARAIYASKGLTFPQDPDVA
ncbi:MAG: TetR/AcrR family transcriptional regulator, partial [Nevskiales bacterium]